MRGLNGYRQISLHTHAQPHTYSLPRLRLRPRPLPLPLLLPLAVSSLCLTARRVRLRFTGSVYQRRQKNNAPAPGTCFTQSSLLSCHIPNFRPPQKRHPPCRNPHPPNQPGQHVSMCPCSHLRLVRRAEGPGWLARRLRWYRNVNPCPTFFALPPARNPTDNLTEICRLAKGPLNLEPRRTPAMSGVSGALLLTSLQGDS